MYIYHTYIYIYGVSLKNSEKSAPEYMYYMRPLQS